MVLTVRPPIVLSYGGVYNVHGAWVSEGIFSSGAIVDFSMWWQKAFFQGGPTLVKSHFTNWKLSEKILY